MPDRRKNSRRKSDRNSHVRPGLRSSAGAHLSIFMAVLLALLAVPTAETLLVSGTSTRSPALLAGIFSAGAIILIPFLFLLGWFIWYRGVETKKNARLNARCERLSDEIWQLREVEERYQNLVERQGDLVLMRTADGIVTYASPAVCRTFGLKMEEFLYTRLKLPVISGETDIRPGMDTRNRLVALETVDGEAWFSWIDVPVRDRMSGTVVYHTVARDVTAQKEVEAVLARARDDAEAANRAKTQFLAAISHEIRTPLAGILGMAGLLRDSELTAEQGTYLDAMTRSGETLARLIDDILDLSKAEAGRLDIRPGPMSPEETVQDVIELIAPRAFDKGIEIGLYVSPDMPEKILLDEGRIRQILFNIAGNAVKFTEKGGVRVHLDYHAGDDDSGRFEITVHDSGPGFNMDEKDRLFKEFEQADGSETRAHGGAGLGLAIVDRLVRLMGGEIDAIAEPEKGASFMVSVPAKVLEPCAPAAADYAGRQVLICGAGQAEGPILGASLEDGGCQISYAATVRDAAGVCAAAQAAGTPISYILIARDVCGDLTADLKTLREAAGGKTLALVLLKPNERPDLETIRATGFDAYLMRPVRRSSLHKMLNQIRSEAGEFTPDPADAPRPVKKVRQADTRARVLLAEDNPVNALLAKALLERLNCDVHHVENGIRAIAAIEASAQTGEGFDIALLDLHMPEADGLTVARHVRSMDRGNLRALPALIALTADAQDHVAEACLEAGFAAFFTKPLDREKFEAGFDTVRRELTQAA